MARNSAPNLEMDNVCIDRLSPDQLEHLIDRADIDRAGSTDDRAIALWWVLTFEDTVVQGSEFERNAISGTAGGLETCPECKRKPESKRFRNVIEDRPSTGLRCRDVPCAGVHNALTTVSFRRHTKTEYVAATRMTRAHLYPYRQFSITPT